MASKMICLFLFGMLHAEHAAADADEAWKIGKALSKFMPAPAAQMPRSVAQESSIAQSDLPMQLATLEARSQEMRAEYQRLRARIQMMPRADDRSSLGSAAPFGWFAAAIASVGAAAVGAAAVRKYSGNGQHESESTSGSQISLVPQRAGVITASAAVAPSRSGDVRMFSEGDIGVLPPLGVYDPLGLIETRDMGRYEIMEIKHGRAAMLGFLHVVFIEAGIRLPIDDCANAPAGCIASLEAVPTVGWLQIMLTTCMIETGVFLGKSQTGGYAGVNPSDGIPGDIAGIPWVRYDDPEVKTFKLNVERQNGRAAMLGMTGCLIHELLGVDALYPTGGLGGGAPPTIF